MATAFSKILALEKVTLRREAPTPITWWGLIGDSNEFTEKPRILTSVRYKFPGV